jgi:hypothetical protein
MNVEESDLEPWEDPIKCWNGNRKNTKDANNYATSAMAFNDFDVRKYIVHIIYFIPQLNINK